jgi:purine-cytosine permease-like protein
LAISLFLCCGLAAVGQTLELSFSPSPFILIGLGLLIGGAVALSQWFLLRRSVEQAGLWLGLSLMGWLIGFGLAWPLGLAVMVSVSASLDHLEPMNVTFGLFAGLGIGLIIMGLTALVLILCLPWWLLRRSTGSYSEPPQK